MALPRICITTRIMKSSIAVYSCHLDAGHYNPNIRTDKWWEDLDDCATALDQASLFKSCRSIGFENYTDQIRYGSLRST